MEMRPNLRYIYLGGVQPENFDWCDPMGFRQLAPAVRYLDGVSHRTYRLDMGPGSVDAWLAGLVATELGIAPERIGELEFDREAREVRTGAETVSLTALEAGVLGALWDRAGKPVSRAQLLEQAWSENGDAGSNVVDAVVLGLRRKLGPEAAAIETVRGIGYRLRAV
jgi:DNA-binding response OmpR family regulator